MAVLKIVKAPDPVLTKKTELVKDIDNSIKKLVKDMLDTMYHDDGIGLAANQVGVSKRITVLDLQDNDEQERPKGFYPLILINAHITHKSKQKNLAQEGCLSVPDQKIDIERPEEITVEYLDIEGKKQEITTNGWLARAIQHELDHLDGKLLIDYLSKLKKDVVIRKLKKIKKLLA